MALKKSRAKSKVSNKSIEDHVTQQAHGLIETDSELTNRKETVPWEVNEVEAESDIHLEEDKGLGRPVILRKFDYFLPNLPQQPSHAELLEQNLPRIKAMLWKDSLDLILEPKIVSNKQGGFTIFATCSPRMGAIMYEQPQTLSEAANKPREY